MSSLFLLRPLGLFALAAVAAVVALYLFRRRHTPLKVTGLFLWGGEGSRTRGGRRRERLLRNRSFWLDVAAALFLGLAVAGPAGRGAGRPIGVIVDDSFAMRSRGCDREAARIAAALLDGAAGREAGLLFAGEDVVVARGMEPIASGGGRRALAAYRPAARRGDVALAVARARRLWGDGAELHVVTNQDAGAAGLGAAGEGATVHVLAGFGANAAVTQVWRSASEKGGERLDVVGRNYSAAPASVEVVIGAIDAGGEGVFAETVGVAAGGQFAVTARLAGRARQTLRVAVTPAGDDAIPDDSFVLVPPRPQTGLTYGLDGIAPEAARYLVPALEAAGLTRSSAPDLLITNRSEAQGGVATLEIPAPDRPGLVSPPYLLDYDNPLCVDLDLSGGHWAVATPGRPEPSGPRAARQIFVSAGGMPLYWLSGERRFHLNMMIEKCPLVQDAAWPVLIANLAARCRDLLPGLRQTLYAPGAALRLAAPAGPVSIENVDAGGADVAAAVLPREPGLYRVRAGEVDVGLAAVAPFFGAASDTTVLAANAAVLRPDNPDARSPGAVDLTLWCLAAALAALAANWWLARRGGEG